MREDLESSDKKEEKVTYKNLRIPLQTDEALAALLRVKPTADMPRPGANPTTATTPKRDIYKGRGREKSRGRAKKGRGGNKKR